MLLFQLGLQLPLVLLKRINLGCRLLQLLAQSQDFGVLVLLYLLQQIDLVLRLFSREKQLRIAFTQKRLRGFQGFALRLESCFLALELVTLGRVLGALLIFGCEVLARLLKALLSLLQLARCLRLDSTGGVNLLVRQFVVSFELVALGVRRS